MSDSLRVSGNIESEETPKRIKSSAAFFLTGL